MHTEIYNTYKQLTDVVYKVSRFFEHSLNSNEEALSYAKNRIGDWYKYFHLGYDPGAAKIQEFAHMNNIGSQLLFDTGILNQLEDKIYSLTTHRLTIPLIDIAGNFLGFSARVLPSREANAFGKYVNTSSTPIFAKSLFLYNLYNAIQHIQTHKYAILVEGNIDVMSMYSYGIQNVVAPCGTSFTYTQALLLKYFTDVVIVCYDADAAGEKAYQKTSKHLAKANISTHLAKLPSGDPDSFIRQHGKDEFLQLFAHAVPLETL